MPPGIVLYSWDLSVFSLKNVKVSKKKKKNVKVSSL